MRVLRLGFYACFFVLPFLQFALVLAVREKKFYDILGVPTDASAGAIKKGYRKAALCAPLETAGCTEASDLSGNWAGPCKAVDGRAGQVVASERLSTERGLSTCCIATCNKCWRQAHH